MTNLEDELRAHYLGIADQLELPARSFESIEPSPYGDVSYISMGPEPRRRTPILLATAACIALLAGAATVVSQRSSNQTAGNGAIVASASAPTTVAATPESPTTVSSSVVCTTTGSSYTCEGPGFPQPTGVERCPLITTTPADGAIGVTCWDMQGPPLWATYLPPGFEVQSVDYSADLDVTKQWNLIRYGSPNDTGTSKEIKLQFIRGNPAEQPGITPPGGVDSFGGNEIFLRGTRATYTTGFGFGVFYVSIGWEERPDLYVQLESSEVSQVELIRMAEGLVVLTEEAWRSLNIGGTIAVAVGTNRQGYVDPATPTTTAP